MSRPEDQIVFEDLHGMQEDKPVTVDLDADLKERGIQSAPDDQSVDSGAADDDGIVIDDLHSAQAESQDDDGGAASRDSGDDDYSKKVKARIDREKRVTRKERQRADQQSARADYWKTQAEELAKSQYETKKDTFKSTVEQADSAIGNIRTELTRAIEDGNTERQVELTDSLTDWKAKKARAEASLENLSPDGNLEPFDDKISPEGRKTTKSKSETWMDDRGDWYRRAGFERATRLANRLDKEVFDDGYSPDTDEYFEELDKRIKAKMPELYEDADDGAGDDDKDDKDETPRGKSVVAPVGGNETRHQRSSGSKVELGPEDFATMREFNLDPNDPEVLKEFARNKAEAERGGRR